MATNDPLAVWLAIAVAAFLAGAGACHLIWLARMAMARAVAAKVAFSIVEDGLTTMARAWLTVAGATALMFLVLYITGVWSPQQPQSTGSEPCTHEVKEGSSNVPAPRVTGDLHSRGQPSLQRVLDPLAQPYEKAARSGQDDGALQLSSHGASDAGRKSQGARDGQSDVPPVRIPACLHSPISRDDPEHQLTREAI